MGNRRQPGTDASRGGMGLRARRMQLGLTLESLSQQTRIPVQYLQAIEEDRLDALPAGPYAEAWLRAVRAVLQVPEEAPAGPPGGSAQDEGARRMRIAATVVLAVTLVLLALQQSMSGPDTVVASEAPDQIVRMVAQRDTRVLVEVDGALEGSMQLRSGEEVQFEAEHRIAVRLQGANHVKVYYNGERVVPLGAQDEPRRLVFVDDLDG